MRIKTNVVGSRRKGSFFQKNQRQFYLWSLALIPILYELLFSYSTKFGIILAFKRYNYRDGILKSPWVGLDNFKFFLTSGDFTRVLRNTVGNNLVFIFVGMVSAILFALVLYEIQSKITSKIFQTLSITPHFVSWVIGSYIVYAFLNPQGGVINSLLQTMGIEPISWYSNPKPWPVILAICFVWKSVGMDAVLYYSTLMGIDSSLYEAAYIDGASEIQKTWYITLPELKNLVCLLLIMKLGGIFGSDFGLFYQVTKNVGALYPTTDVISTYVFRAMMEVRDYGMSTAVAFMNSVVGFMMVWLSNFIIKKVNPESALF